MKCSTYVSRSSIEARAVACTPASLRQRNGSFRCSRKPNSSSRPCAIERLNAFELGFAGGREQSYLVAQGGDCRNQTMRIRSSPSQGIQRQLQPYGANCRVEAHLLAPQAACEFLPVLSGIDNH